MKVSEINAAAEAVKQERGNEGTRVTPYPGTYETPASIRLQYEYELERSREISSSITRLVTMIPLMMAGVCLLLWVTTTYCTEDIAADYFIILCAADIIVLLCALVVACTVHFYILNPAPTQPEEKEWLTKMNRDLQRGNNWRAWLVFAATILIYAAAGIALAIVILGLIGL